MRKMVCSTVALFILVYSITGIAGGFWKNIDVLENDIRVVVDGEVVEKENFVYNDSTYLPLRAVAEIAGMDVQYDGDSNTAYLSTDVAGNESREEYLKNISLIIDFMGNCEIFAERLLGKSSHIPLTINAIEHGASNKQEFIDDLVDDFDRLVEWKEQLFSVRNQLEQWGKVCELNLTELFSGLDLLDSALINFRFAQDFILSLDKTGDSIQGDNAMYSYTVGCEQTVEAANMFQSLRNDFVAILLLY